jgi:hypothetical protein
LLQMVARTAVVRHGVLVPWPDRQTRDEFVQNALVVCYSPPWLYSVRMCANAQWEYALTHDRFC